MTGGAAPRAVARKEDCVDKLQCTGESISNKSVHFLERGRLVRCQHEEGFTALLKS